MGRSSARKRERRFAAIGSDRTAPMSCPYCRKLLDAVTGVAYDSTVAPKIEPGDHSMCAYCFKILLFDGTGYRRVSPGKAAVVFERSKLLRDFRASQIQKRKETVN